MRFLGVAGVLVAIAAALVDADALHDAVFRDSWFYSRPLLHDLRIAGIVTGACIAVLPWLLAILRRPPDERVAAPRGARWMELVFVAALVLASLWTCVEADPITGDAKGFLGRALEIARSGGVPGLFRGCLSGTWAEAVVSPLYLALIAPFAEESNRFLDSARLVALAGSVATFLAVLRACRRRGGETAAWLAAALLVTNGAFLLHGALPACESWFTCFAVLACDLATRADASLRRALALGACIGLAFLTKGTGTLLLASTCAWLLWSERLRAWRRFLSLAAGFVLVAWPLLLRNVRLFGDPFYNVNSRRALWLDRWSDFMDPRMLEQAGPGKWFATHGVLDAFARIALGFVKQVVHLLEACAPLEPGASLGAALLVLLAACLVRSEPALRGFLALFLALWVACFSWYAPVVSDRRFLAVLVPIVMPVIGTLTTRLRPAAQRRVRIASVAVAVLVAGLAVADGALHFRPSRFRPEPCNASLHEHLRAVTGGDPDAVYVLGPSVRLGFDWDGSLAANRTTSPRDAAGFARLLAESRGRRVRFVVLEPPGVRPRFSDAWTRVLADGSLELAEVPPGWRAAARFPEDRPRAILMTRAGR